MKKFFSLVLALVMALSLTTVAWGADASVSTTDELNTALAQAESGNTITLAAGPYDLTVAIPAGVTLVGADKESTVLNLGAAQYKISNNNVTIKNVTIKDEVNSDKIGLYVGGVNVTLESVNYASVNQSAISLRNKTTTDNTFTLKNSTLSSAGRGIGWCYFTGTILVEESVIDAGNSIHIDEGGNQAKIVINDSTLYGNVAAGTTASLEFDGATFNASKLDAYGSAYAGVSSYSAAAPRTFENCTFTSSTDIGKNTENFTLINCNLNGTPITAENIKTLMPDHDYTANNVTVDGEVAGVVAEVNGTEYKTLAAAVAAAPAGGTVKLLADNAENVTVDKALTFDFNGYTYSGFVTPASGYTYMDGVVKQTPASGTTSTGSVTSGTVTATKAKMYRLATAGTSMTELYNVTKIEKTTVTGKLVNDVPVYVPNIYKLDGVFYVEVAKAHATYALKNNGAYVYLAPAGSAADVNAVIAKFATTVVLDQYVAAAEDVECGDAVKGTKGAAIYMSGTDAYYADGSNWAVFKGEFVTYDKNTKVAYKEHKWDAKSIIVKATDVKGVKVPVSIECEDCEKTFSIVPSSKFDNTWVKGVNYTTDDAVNAYNTASVKYYIVLTSATSANTYVPSTGTVVQSAETFDAGIAMYVGMSVMAAAGSAVVIGKKKD